MKTEIEVNEKPILFSGAMVRAILDGSKTQTRRVIKPQPPAGTSRLLGPEMYAPTVVDQTGFEQPGAEIYGVYNEWGDWGVKCPYGRPGDRLWVRETWGTFSEYDNLKPSKIPVSAYLFYRANKNGNVGKWRPSIFMPRWASRLILEVTAVWVERIQDISYENAIAEGIDHKYPEARVQFRDLWDSINAKRGYSWESNPWVWSVEFMKI